MALRSSWPRWTPPRSLIWLRSMRSEDTRPSSSSRIRSQSSTQVSWLELLVVSSVMVRTPPAWMLSCLWLAHLFVSHLYQTVSAFLLVRYLSVLLVLPLFLFRPLSLSHSAVPPLTHSLPPTLFLPLVECLAPHEGLRNVLNNQLVLWLTHF